MSDGVLKSGDTFDEYEVVREIGRGGMGVVYLALDAHEREVAIKTLRFARTVGPSEELRFKNEIRILHSIDHVNVVRFFKAGKLDQESTGSVLWVALEYLDGPSLRDIIAERPGRLDPEDINRWAKQIADGLCVAHSLGVIHRDLKPANIKFDGKTAKVIDFGVASARDIGGLTAAGSTVGTLGYMAPEQLETSAKCDGRADVFALGIIIYEMAVGHHPMAREGEPPTTAELLARLLTADAPPLKEVVPGFPAHLSDIAERAMQRDREKRFASMLDMRKALDAAMRAYRSEHRPLMLGDLSGTFDPLSPLSKLAASSKPISAPTTEPVPTEPTPDASPAPGRVGPGGWTPNQRATIKANTPEEAIAHAQRQANTVVSERIDETQAMDGPPPFDPTALQPTPPSARPHVPPAPQPQSHRSRTPLAAIIGAIAGIVLGLAITTSLRAVAGGGDESADVASADDGATAAPASEPAVAPEPVALEPARAADAADESELSPAPTASATATASVSVASKPPPAAAAPLPTAARRPTPPPARPKPAPKVPFGSKPEF